MATAADQELDLADALPNPTVHFGGQALAVFNGTTWDRLRSANGDAQALTGLAAASGMVYNGATWDRARTPNVFKSLSAAVVTNETTIWTPAAGKKFRLMGMVISQGVLTGALTIRDNTAGSTILIVPQTTIGVAFSFELGNGILSAAANNVLTAQGATAETITGFVFGTEES